MTDAQVEIIRAEMMRFTQEITRALLRKRRHEIHLAVLKQLMGNRDTPSDDAIKAAMTAGELLCPDPPTPTTVEAK